MVHFPRRSRIRWFAVTACGILLLLAGCGGPKTGSVSGRVTCNGRVVTSGQVALTPADGVPRLGEISAEGTYFVTGVPVGQVIVTVTRPDPAQPEGNPEAIPGPLAPRPPDWFAIPARYGDRSLSGLRLEVQSDHQEYDLELK